MDSKIEQMAKYTIRLMSSEQEPTKAQLDKQYKNYAPMLIQYGDAIYIYSLDVKGDTQLTESKVALLYDLLRGHSFTKEPIILRGMSDETYIRLCRLIAFQKKHIPESLNEMQKNIIQAYLKFPLDGIFEACEKKPFLMIKALFSIMVENISPEDEKVFKEENVWNEISQIRSLLSHPRPQDSYSTGGLLGLTIKNDDTALPVTKEAMVNYIHKQVNNLIEEQQQLLMCFETAGQNKLFELRINQHAVTIHQFIHLFFEKLTQLSEYSIDNNQYTNKDKLLPADFQFLYMGKRFDLTHLSDLDLTFFEYLQKYHASNDSIENKCSVAFSHNKALFSACRAKNAREISVNHVKSLLEEGADPNSTHHCDLFPNVSVSKNFDFSPLHIIAGKKNSVEIAEILITHGAKINQTDSCIGNTPLLTAIARRDENLAKFLIEKIRLSDDPSVKVVLDQKDTGRECQNTPLVLALKKRMDEIALLLINAGANANVTCRNRETALHWACMLRKNNVISALLESGTDKTIVNQFGRTAYEYYVYPLRLIDITKPDQKDNQGACKTHLPEFSDLWFHVSEYYSDERYPQFKILADCRNSRPVDVQLAEKIMAIGTANITLEEQHKKLVDKKYNDLCQEAKRFGEAYFLPSDGRNLADFLSEVVLEMNIEKKQERFKQAELSLAVKERNKTKIEELLTVANKATVNAPSSDGFTALHWAAMQRNDDLIKKLMAADADPTIKNKYGRTPMDYYQYQVRKADFEKSMSAKSYEELCKWASGFATGPEKMPEFDEVFPQSMGRVEERNSKPVDLLIFGPNFPLNQAIEEEEKMPLKANASSQSSQKKPQQKVSTHHIQELLKMRALLEKSDARVLSQTQAKEEKMPMQVQSSYSSSHHGCRGFINNNTSRHSSLKKPVEFVAVPQVQSSSTTIFFNPNQTTATNQNQPTNTIPPDLQNALYSGCVKEDYINTGITTLENLIALHEKAPWAIDALRCFNIREGITKKYISIDDLWLLNEEQTHGIEHKYQGNELTAKVKEFIIQNKVGATLPTFSNNG